MHWANITLGLRYIALQRMCGRPSLSWIFLYIQRLSNLFSVPLGLQQNKVLLLSYPLEHLCLFPLIPAPLLLPVLPPSGSSPSFPPPLLCRAAGETGISLTVGGENLHRASTHAG